MSERVQQALHDIHSPITAMSSILNACEELPEEKRAMLRRFMNSTFKMLYNLASHFDSDINAPLSEKESRQDVLMADCINGLLDEKKYHYLRQPVDFELHISRSARNAHIDAQPGQLRRALSTIINNAIEALTESRPGAISLFLDADLEWVTLSIDDNGRGMTADTVQRMTENKIDGRGPGLQQVWDTVKNNNGRLEVKSEIGQGTSFQFTFPRFQPADWIVREIVLEPDTMLLILDDDTLVLESWELLINPMLKQHPELRVKGFTQGETLLTFIQTLTDEERKRVLLLADYELPHQKHNGLEIIISSKMAKAILITAHTSDPEVREAAMKGGINLLPKHLLGDVPVRVESEREKKWFE